MQSTHKKLSSWSVDTDEKRYRAGMVLGGVGDALGSKNGEWEFCYNGQKIHEELRDMGGVKEINVKNWMVIADAILHLDTADALIQNKHCENKEKLYSLLAGKYNKHMDGRKDKVARHTCTDLCIHDYRIPFDPSDTGCGAAMRSMCIGLRYPRLRDIEDLIEVSIESGRMTHHHPTGYLGSLASALFTSYAVQGNPLKEWGAGLMDTLKQAKKYIISCKDIYVKENVEAWGYFETKWEHYLKLRNIWSGREEPQFPIDFTNVQKREQFYSMISFDTWGGSSGHDAPMIAYDALLASGDNWEELCNRAMFHGGDNDSTGSIAGCLFGILYGLKDVPSKNYKQLEYRDRLEQAGSDLYKLVFGDFD